MILNTVQKKIQKHYFSNRHVWYKFELQWVRSPLVSVPLVRQDVRIVERPQTANAYPRKQYHVNKFIHIINIEILITDDESEEEEEEGEEDKSYCHILI